MSPSEEGAAAIEAISGGNRGGLPGPETDVSGVGLAAAKAAGPAASAAPQLQGTATGPDPVESLLSSLRPVGTRLAVEKDEETGELVVKVMDPDSGEVIRQLPSREILKLAESIDRYLGLMVDKRS